MAESSTDPHHMAGQQLGDAVSALRSARWLLGLASASEAEIAAVEGARELVAELRDPVLGLGVRR